MIDHGAERIGSPGGRPVAYTWNGDAMSGVAGDTVASALIAAGARVFHINPTSGEARGGLCMVGRCADCLVIVDGQPGVMACVTPLDDRMRVERQDGHGRWGGGTA